MTRTFVAGGGEPPAELAEYWRLTKDSLDRVYADIRAGVNGRALFERSCRAVHRGRPADAADQEARHDARGRLLPRRSGTASGWRSTSARTWAGWATSSLAGDVVTVEPGCYRRGFGGCRLEDLVRGHRGRLRGPDRFPVRPVK